ncbi:hypothetical protein BJ165DRAFT_1440001 [Panaeolus papilionaceus]|nr:hypothetical protein BJ165DRAFT_1440001 [Panaeolus papilionaceus]
MFLRATELLPLQALHLGCSQMTPTSAAREIKAFAQGSSKRDAALFRRICIDYHDLFESDDSAQVLSYFDRVVLQYLSKAMRSFLNAETVSVILNNTQPSFLAQSILDGLKDMSSLRHVIITCDYSSWLTSEPLQFPSLSNLESFTFKSPTLTSDTMFPLQIAHLLTQCPDLVFLELDICTNMDIIFTTLVNESGSSLLRLQHLKLRMWDINSHSIENLIPHLQHLKSIALLQHYPQYRGDERVWDLFLRNRIFVSDIKTDLIDDSFVSYVEAVAPRKLTVSIVWSPPAGVMQYLDLSMSFQHSTLHAFICDRLVDLRHALVELIFDMERSLSWHLQHDTGALEALSTLKHIKRLHFRATPLIRRPAIRMARGTRILCGDCMEDMIAKLIEFCYASYPELEELHVPLGDDKPRWLSEHDQCAPHIVHPWLGSEDPTVWFDISERVILNFPVSQSWDTHFFDIILCGVLYEVWRDPKTSTAAYVKSRRVRPVLP